MDTPTTPDYRIYWKYPPCINNNTQFNYKCPNCGGCFDFAGNANLDRRCCPFCGKIMEGMQ